jgi:hypothetical protein
MQCSDYVVILFKTIVDDTLRESKALTWLPIGELSREPMGLDNL